MARSAGPRARRRRALVGVATAVVLALMAAGCAGSDLAASGDAGDRTAAPNAGDVGGAAGAAGPVGSVDPDAATGPDGTAPAGTAPTTAVPRPSVPYVPTTIGPPPALLRPAAPTCALQVAQPAPTSTSATAAPTTPAVPTPTTLPDLPAAPDPEPPPPPDASSTTSSTQPPSATPAAALERFAADPRVAGATMSVSVWADGLGEVAARNPDTPLVPASNQKLLIAIGALRLLDPNERLHTDLVVTGPIVDGVVQGDVVVVGGGDPTLTLAGDHSLDRFVTALADAGVTAIDGHVLVDDSRYDAVRSGRSWPGDWPTYAGAMSALMADRNHARRDAAYLADPALGNGEVLRYALNAKGIAAPGPVGHTEHPTGMVLASLPSPTIGELVTIMLFRSDNLIAELLAKEIGHRATGAPGTTEAGMAAVRALVQQQCLTGALAGVDADASGLSYDDRRSARELRRILLAAQLQPWGPSFVTSLPLAGTPGALGGRLNGPRTAGNVRAKGGSLAVTRSLSGYLTTASGRHVVFSIILNGPRVGGAEGAIDAFVTDLASQVG